MSKGVCDAIITIEESLEGNTEPGLNQMTPQLLPPSTGEPQELVFEIPAFVTTFHVQI